MQNILQMQSLFLFFKKGAFFISQWCFCLCCKWFVACVCCCNMYSYYHFVFIGMSAFQSPRNFLNTMHANFTSQMCKLHKHFPSLLGKKAGSCRSVYTWYVCAGTVLKPQLFESIFCFWASLLNPEQLDLTISKLFTHKQSRNKPCILWINLKVLLWSYLMKIFWRKLMDKLKKENTSKWFLVFCFVAVEELWKDGCDSLRLPLFKKRKRKRMTKDNKNERLLVVWKSLKDSRGKTRIW